MWKSFVSLIEEGFLFDEKRLRCNVFIFDSELSSELDEVIYLLNMVEMVMFKIRFCIREICEGRI